MLILLPPSEGKTAARRGKPLDLGRLASPSLTRPANGCSPHSSTSAPADADAPPPSASHPARQTWCGATPAPDAPTARADRVYTGVLYDALGFGNPPPPAQAPRGHPGGGDVLAVRPGLAPGDRIPAYRLSGDATLPGVGAVAGFWRDHLDPAVREPWAAGCWWTSGP